MQARELSAHILPRLRSLVLPGSRAFRNAGIHTKLSVLFYLTTFFAIAAIGLYGYLNASTAYRDRAVQLLENDRDRVVESIDEFLALQRNDLGFINNFYALLRLSYWNDLAGC